MRSLPTRAAGTGKVDDDLRTVIDLTDVVDLTATTDAGRAKEGDHHDPVAPLRPDPPMTDDPGDDETDAARMLVPMSRLQPRTSPPGPPTQPDTST